LSNKSPEIIKLEDNASEDQNSFPQLRLEESSCGNEEISPFQSINNHETSLKLNVNAYSTFKDHDESLDKHFGSTIDTESKKLKQAICQIKDTFQSKMNPEFTGLLDSLVAFISSK